MVAIVLGATSVIVASPLASPMVVRRQDTVGSDVAQVGRCPVRKISLLTFLFHGNSRAVDILLE